MSFTPPSKSLAVLMNPSKVNCLAAAAPEMSCPLTINLFKNSRV